MAEQADWAFPLEMRPRPEDWRFDLDAALDSVVQLRAEIPEDAFTAPILGTERAGNGIVIREDSLVLTIGYLITEASTIWLTTNQGVVTGGFPVAYDQATGFGLVQPLGRLGARALERGTTAPAHPQWGGAALIGADGKLLGIGSLLVQEKIDSGTLQGNMVVPIDLLEPILDDMVKTGRSRRPSHPWLGMYTTEAGKKLVVAGLAPGGPAERAGMKIGDVVVEVAHGRPASLADLWRRVWRAGPAGAEVQLKIVRNLTISEVRLKSADRSEFLKKPHLH